jgi:Protein of unknown function (DUF3467)
MDDKKKGDVTITTDGYPSVYANHAAVSMSAVDIRIFFAEVSPKELNVEPQETVKAAEALVTPRFCLVMAPEFAKQVFDSLSTLIPQYESRFGPLRPNPGPLPFDSKK